MTTSTLAPVQDLNLLRTFLAVHRAGSFTAAAPALGLTQPTVTSQIRALEAQLGRQLFQRLPRGVEPTAFARELAERISGPLDDLDVVAGGNFLLDPGPGRWRQKGFVVIAPDRQGVETIWSQVNVRNPAKS